MKAEAIVLVALGMAGSLLADGCSAYRSPATGEKAYYGCETLRTKLNADIGAVYAAARCATRELRLKPMRAAEDGISGEILALNARRDTVEIRLGALPEGRTALRIRIGVFGDKKKSIVLLERILENLIQQEEGVVTPVVQWSEQAIGLPKR